MPVGLPPPRTPSAPPPGNGVPPRFSSARGRRTLALFGAGALVLVLGFLLFAGAEFVYLVRKGGNSQVSSSIPTGLPPQVPFCTGFVAQRSFTTDVEGGKHFLVQGSCPENHLQLDDDLTRLLQYNGWTVHDDGQDTLSSYSYERHQRVDIGMTRASTSNRTTVTVEVWTGLKHPPDGFPTSPGASPAPG